MPRFFSPAFAGKSVGDTVALSPEDSAHARRSLRMNIGDTLDLCDEQGRDLAAHITEFSGDLVFAAVDAVCDSHSEPHTRVTLYQGLPKGDKFEQIIQKSVELGAAEIVPVEMSRSIAKIGDKGDKKLARFQKIADEAAGQSERGMKPAVRPPLSFKEAVAKIQNAGGKTLVCYERGGVPLKSVLSPADEAVALVIGPEGGIAPEELQALEAAGATAVTLGPRILRTETAPLAALAVVMDRTDNM